MKSKTGFDSLAPELILPILTYLSDLESLDNLLRASPAAFRLFETHGPEVFEAVLAASSKSNVIHEYTCALIRINAMVRSESIPSEAESWIGLKYFIGHYTTSFVYHRPQWTGPSTKLSSDVPATVLRGILATSRKITCLTISCLNFYLKPFRALRPSHLVDKTFTFESDWYGDDDHYIPAWKLKPEEEPFPVQDIGPPTWIEEQRVIRAFWRLQLYHDLKTTTYHPLKSSGYVDRMLNMLPIVELYEPDIGDMEMTGGEPYYHQMDVQLEYELIWSVVDYVKNDRLTIAAPEFLQTKREWPTPLPTGPKDFEILADWSSWTMRYFHKVGGVEDTHVMGGCVSPVQHVSFELFRRLGFAIWDNERMVSYGFLDPGLGYMDDSYLLAWKSILGRDEIEKVERINQERYNFSMGFAEDKGDSGDRDVE